MVQIPVNLEILDFKNCTYKSNIKENPYPTLKEAISN